MAGKKAERDRLRKETAIARAVAEDFFVKWFELMKSVRKGDVEAIDGLSSAELVEFVRYIPPENLWRGGYLPPDLFFAACLSSGESGADATTLKIAQILALESLNDPSFDLRGRRHGMEHLTPLHIAVLSCSPAVVAALLPCVDALAESVDGESAHRLATRRGDDDLARLIDERLTQIERNELEASTPGPAGASPEAARRRRIDSFAK